MATAQKRGETYRIRASAGYSSDGKQIMRSMTWKPAPGMTARQIQKELERQAVLFEERVSSGRYIDENVRFEELTALWYEQHVLKNLRQTTAEGYERYLRTINAALGNMKLCKIQPHHLRAFYDNLREEGVKQTQRHSPKVDMRATLRAAGHTQKAFMKLSGVSSRTMSRLYAGENVSGDVARSVADALGQPLGKLFAPVESGTLAETTIRQIHMVISSVFTFAMQEQAILYNPCRSMRSPKRDTQEASFLDEEYLPDFLAKLNREPLAFRAIVMLFLCTGMRRGELCGLEWEDIDFTHNLVSISKSSLYLPKNGVFDDSTKTASSNRITKIPEDVTELLRQLNLEQQRRRLQLGDKWQGSKKVSLNEFGAQLNPSALSARFKAFAQRAGYPDITLKSLRHTSATLLIMNGTNIKTVSSRLGHSNVSTTGTIYTHAIKTADERAAQVLGDVFGLKKKSGA